MKWEWRRLHNKELSALYSSPNIIWVIIWETGKLHTGFYWGDMRERDHLKDLGIDRRIILKRSLEKREGGMDWIDLAEGRNRWQVLANAVMNLQAQ
jgi:hypothetical protein